MTDSLINEELDREIVSRSAAMAVAQTKPEAASYSGIDDTPASGTGAVGSKPGASSSTYNDDDIDDDDDDHCLVIETLDDIEPKSEFSHFDGDPFEETRSKNMRYDQESMIPFGMFGATSHGGQMAGEGMHPGHQGPPPISPPPPAPQISAEELSLLTEASATRNGTFQCTLCSKQFGYKNGLIRHVRLTHVGEKPYQCTICNRRFGYKHILIEHQNLHFGNRPYACVQCDKRFAARSNLVQHRMVHKRPFHCQLCPKRFDRDEQLKKHLFAHPQAMQMCSICRHPVPSEEDMARHVLEVHNKDCMVRRHLCSLGSSEGRGHHGLRGSARDVEDMDDRDEIDKGECHIPTNSCRSRGQRIDAIPSQLSSSASSTGFSSPDFDVVIKKELAELETQEDGNEQVDKGTLRVGSSSETYKSSTSQSPRLSAAVSQQIINSIVDSGTQSAAAAVAAAAYSQFLDQFPWPSKLVSPSSKISSGTAASSVSSSYSAVDLLAAAAVAGKSLSMPVSASIEALSSSTLPGIHEMFSGGQNQKLPSFANFMPTSQNPTAHVLSEFAIKPSSVSQPTEQKQTTSSNETERVTSVGVSHTAGSGGPVSNQRPTAQLPPIAHTLRVREDRNPTSASTSLPTVSESETIERGGGSISVSNLPPLGYPPLEDVISHYVTQGRLFKCVHCNILFFERGMYFLHSSLHGTSPWECSICHKQCADKNEFTLHFVNQQHNS